MAIWLCDISHATSGGNGDGWADGTGAGKAINSIVTALAGAAAGDTIYLRDEDGNGVEATADIQLIGSTSPALPKKVMGVKVGTSNTTPVQSDLIAGEGAGAAAGTRAYDSTVPIIKVTGSASDIFFKEGLYFYGIKFEAGNTIGMSKDTGDEVELEFEECEYAWALEATGADFFLGNGRSNVQQLHKRCKWTFAGTSSIFMLSGEVVNCTIIDAVWAGTSPFVPFLGLLGRRLGGTLLLYGSDLTGGATTQTSFGVQIGVALDFKVIRCKVDSGGTGFAPTQGSVPKTEQSVGADPVSPLGAGESDQDFKQYMWNGDLTTETTVIRTDGATDGAGGAFSWSLTPHTGETEERFIALESPWINGWVDGDGGSKTLTIYITNNNSVVFADDDVSIEVMYPSEDGNRKGGYKETRGAILEATPNVISADAASTWGGSGSEDTDAQKITISIAPAYSGAVRVRVNYWKAGTDTLFIDPQIYIL